MLIQGFRFIYRLFFGNTDKIGIFLLPIKYRRTLVFLFKKTGGFRKVYHFICTKIWSRGERVGLQAGDPFALMGHTLDVRMIEIELSTKCHLRCDFCEQPFFSTEYKNWELSYEQFVHIMEQFPKLRYWNGTGMGTCWLCKDFDKMLTYAKERNLFTVIIDSFSKISEKQILRLIECCHKVPISLDGVGEAYEKIRKGAKWETTLANIRRFVELRGDQPIPEIIFRFVFCKDNYQTLPLYPAVVNSLMSKRADGFDGFCEFVGLLQFEGTEHLVWEPEPEIIQATEAECRKYGLPFSWSHPSHDPVKMRPIKQCAAYAEPYIFRGGYVISCCSLLMSNRRQWLEDHSFGNIFKQSWEEIWNSPRYVAFRKAVPKSTGPVPLTCVGCRAFSCHGRMEKYGVDETL